MADTLVFKGEFTKYGFNDVLSYFDINKIFSSIESGSITLNNLNEKTFSNVDFLYIENKCIGTKLQITLDNSGVGKGLVVFDIEDIGAICLFANIGSVKIIAQNNDCLLFYIIGRL